MYKEINHGCVFLFLHGYMFILQDSNLVNSDAPLGEIKKGFYCPRCGNSFSNQTEMVQHLREHVLATGDKAKRGRGRPRKDGKPNAGMIMRPDRGIEMKF